MSNHGTNLIENQSLCLFDWSTLKKKPITKGKFWKKFTVTASKVIEKVLTFEEPQRVQECCELSIWQMLDCEVKSDRYQAMPTWSYQWQSVWIFLYDFLDVQVYNCTLGRPTPQPSQLIYLTVTETSTILHGSIYHESCRKTLSKTKSCIRTLHSWNKLYFTGCRLCADCKNW